MLWNSSVRYFEYLFSEYKNRIMYLLILFEKNVFVKSIRESIILFSQNFVFYI